MPFDLSSKKEYISMSWWSHSLAACSDGLTRDLVVCICQRIFLLTSFSHTGIWVCQVTVGSLKWCLPTSDFGLCWRQDTVSLPPLSQCLTFMIGPWQLLLSTVMVDNQSWLGPWQALINCWIRPLWSNLAVCSEFKLSVLLEVRAGLKQFF